MSCKTKKSIILKSQKGTSVVIFAIAFTFIAAFSALVFDIGLAFIDKSKLSNALDAAALSGAQELVTDISNVENIVNHYLNENLSGIKNVSLNIDSSNHTVEVSGVKTTENFFAKIFGIESEDIASTAIAKIENIKSLKGARPLAVIQQNFVYGTLYTLKEGGGDGTTGNYAAIALGGTGGCIYRNNLLYGYPGTISVGDRIPTETGNIAGTTETSINYLVHQCNHTPYCTYEYYNKNCPRIIFIPVVNTLDVNGRKYIEVLGFATFFLEGVVNHAGQADVIGRFITYCMEGETSSDINDYGTYGIRLIK